MKNKRLKRTLLFLLTICTLLCAVMFVACGGNNNQTYHLYQDETYEQDNYIGFYDNDTWKASWNMVGGSYTKSDNTVIFFDAEGNFVISGVMYENVLKLEDGREYRVKGETDEQGRPFTSEAGRRMYICFTT